MKNKYEIIRQGLFVTERSRGSWEKSGYKLFNKAEILADISKNCVESGNEIFLIKDPFSHIPFIFGTKLIEDTSIPAKVILAFNSLMGDGVESLLNVIEQNYYNNAFNNPFILYETNSRSLAFTIEHIRSEPADYEALIKDFIYGAEKLPYVYLHITKDQTDFLLCSNNCDYYNLKEASKEIRNKNPACQEYFYQNGQSREILSQAFSLEKIRLQENDAHRVIFEK